MVVCARVCARGCGDVHPQMHVLDQKVDPKVNVALAEAEVAFLALGKQHYVVPRLRRACLFVEGVEGGELHDRILKHDNTIKREIATSPLLHCVAVLLFGRLLL